MAEKKRYIVASRGGSHLDQNAVKGLEDFVSKSGAKIIKRGQFGPHVMEMTEEEMRKLASGNPDLIIEEDRELDAFPASGQNS